MVFSKMTQTRKFPCVIFTALRQWRKTQAFPDHCIQDLRRNFLKFQTLRDDAKFLRAHNKQEEGHLLARLESGGRDTCDNCDCEIFNAHWVCKTCGRSHCRECPFDALQICPQRNAVHAVEVAVIHSGISRKSRRFFWPPVTKNFSIK